MSNQYRKGESVLRFYIFKVLLNVIRRKKRGRGRQKRERKGERERETEEGEEEGEEEGGGTEDRRGKDKKKSLENFF